ncbi:MAG: NAD-dependent epimerase/dehydratase family protein [Candidatus Micrarchaeia archaeon]
MNYLVTGATGRIGRHLVQKLVSEGKSVRVLIRNEGQAIFMPKGATPVYGDIRTYRIDEDVDVVFHLAALVNHDAPLEKLLDINVNGTKNLLASCKNVKRFIFCSTISVYGKKLKEKPANENTECGAKDPYGKSKLLAEKEVINSAVEWSILRPGVVYGVGFDEGFIPALELLEKGRMPLIGSGDNHIPLIHVSDVVNALILLSESEKSKNDIFVAVGEEQKTQRELFEIACKYLNVPPPKRSVPIWLARAFALYFELFSKKPRITRSQIDTITADRVFDISKIKSIGYKQSVPLEEGIHEMVEYYRRGRD